MLLEHQSKKKEIHASGNGMGKKIPVADGNRFFGSAKPLLTDPLEFFLNQYKKHGPVYEVHALGRRYVILAGPEATRFFKINSAKLFDGRPIYRHYGKDLNSDHVLVGMEGEEHARFRRALLPAFSKNAIGEQYPQMVDTIRNSLDLIPENKEFSVV